MGKSLFMSICLVTVAVPALFANGHNPRRALKRTLLWLAVFNVLYLAYLLNPFLKGNLGKASAAFSEAGFELQVPP